jgi:hypothetical protein
MEKQENIVSVNPLARAGVISTGVVETTNPRLVANEAQQMRIKAALTPEEYTIFTEVGALTAKYPTKDDFYAALTPEQVRIFNKGMTAARKEGGRRRGNMLSAFYSKMTHTRKRRSQRRRGGNKKHLTPAQPHMREIMEKESLLEASKRIVRHAKTRKRGKKISSDKYYEYPKNGRY